MNMSENTNVTEQDETESPFAFISKNTSFILLLTFDIPSILMHLIVFILILFNKALRSAPYNYVILFTLCHSFIITAFMIPTVIDSHRLKPTIHWSLILFAWASFERHLLIFHFNLFNIKWKNFCFHYMPPILITIYLIIFYIYSSYFYPCEHQVDFVHNVCYYGCQSRDPILGMWQTSIHILSPTICVLICNGALLFRVYRSKTRLRQSINWRKYRLMIFQLVSISCFYLLFNLPFAIAYLWVIVAPAPFIITILQRIGFLTYFIYLLFPFVCFCSIPQLGSKMKKFLHRQTVPVSEEMQPRAIRLVKTQVQ
ncbi:unnamed protein product [Adineta steineri]|uniref:Uncharacterized protein n=1 Tax=Adineta steineri TaxID=433720 RepID=A0A819MR45_9BILA|nr:unnamed protein product [Adineta steineri]